MQKTNASNAEMVDAPLSWGSYEFLFDFRTPKVSTNNTFLVVMCRQ